MRNIIARRRSTPRLTRLHASANPRGFLVSSNCLTNCATSCGDGSGLRTSECLRLRVQDMDLEMKALTVRNGKGAKDRITTVPERLVQPRKEYLVRVNSHYRSPAGAHGHRYHPDLHPCSAASPHFSPGHGVRSPPDDLSTAGADSLSPSLVFSRLASGWPWSVDSAPWTALTHVRRVTRDTGDVKGRRPEETNRITASICPLASPRFLCRCGLLRAVRARIRNGLVSSRVRGENRTLHYPGDTT